MIKSKHIVNKIIYGRFGIDPKSSQPIICKINEDYCCSSYVKEDYEKDGYGFWGSHLYIDFPHYPKIDLHGVWRYTVIIPWESTYREYGERDRIILEESDLDDWILICKRHKHLLTDGFQDTYEAFVYKNFTHVLTIPNIDQFTYNRYDINPDNITYTIREVDSENKPIHYTWNGRDAIRLKNESSMSFQEWCATNNKIGLLQFYSPSNFMPVDSSDLSCNSDKIVEWVCHKGHTWTESVKGRISRKGREFECPVCKKMETDFIQSVRESTNEKEAEKQVLSTIKRINNGELFISGYESYPDEVEFTFKYPSNKHGYIAIYLAQNEGELEQLSYDTYKLTYSPSESQQILRMYCCMDSMQYAREEKLCSNKNARDYLDQYCTYFILRKQLSVLCIFQPSYDPKSVSEKGLVIWRQLFKDQRENLNRIYEQMIVSGEDVATWKSERRLYALVKSFFDDAVFQFKTDWLDLQSLDIFIPSLNIGIEYQGKQHYEPIDFFGGKKAFEELQLRDLKKKSLCAEHSVTLIEWRWTEDINRETLFEKLNLS
jgi:hypothetical protein